MLVVSQAPSAGANPVLARVSGLWRSAGASMVSFTVGCSIECWVKSAS